MLALAILVLAIVAPQTARQSTRSPSFACDLAAVKDPDTLNTRLAERAIDALERAARPGWREDPRLAALIRSDAASHLMRGDVGDGFEGVEGFRRVAVKLASSRYLVERLEGIPPPALSGCQKTIVTIEFVHGGQSIRTEVRFTFVDGVIEDATAYDVAFTSGTLAPAANWACLLISK